MHTIKAALAYWGAIFALGMVLGTLRVLWIAPSIGETRAVLIELPVMLAASWFVAKGLVRRFGIRSTGQALAMGALAFALLMASEAGLALVTGGSVSEWFGAMMRMPGALGLAGQVVFAVMPVLVINRVRA
jgi:hypothetical protein